MLRRNKTASSVFHSLSSDDKKLAIDGLNVYKDDLVISLWDKNAILNESRNPNFKSWINDHFHDNDVVMIMNQPKTGTSKQAVMRCDPTLKNCTVLEEI